MQRPPRRGLIDRERGERVVSPHSKNFGKKNDNVWENMQGPAHCLRMGRREKKEDAFLRLALDRGASSSEGEVLLGRVV